MEGVIRRTRYARYGSAVKRKRKTNVRQELIVKIIKQLIVCILILFIITVIKLLNFQPTNGFLAGCKNVLQHETNMQSIYATIDNVVNFFRKSSIPDMFSDNAVPASTSSAGESVPGTEISGGFAADTLSQSINSASSSGGNTSAANKSTSTQGSNSSGGSSPNSASAQAALSTQSGSPNQSAGTATGTATGTAAGTSSAASGTAAGTSATQAAIAALKQKYSFQFPAEGIITSSYGNRIHPIKKTEEFHNGIDIEAPKGTPVKAALDGEVLEVSEDPSFGKFIRLKTDSEIVTVYAHCSQILASKGQKIKKGTAIARIGETGYSTGTHLHFEIWVNGKSTNPAVFFER